MFGFNKYHYSYIYKIVCLDPNIDDFYIGSTVNLSSRYLSHIRCSLNKKKQNYSNKLYTFIRDSGGHENWDMQVIKKFKCENKRELEKEEQKYIDELKPSLNTGNPYKTKEEKEEQVKQWYQDNREELNKKSRKWHQENRKKHKNNKEKMKEIRKDKRIIYNRWYENNKKILNEKRKETIECECGSTFRKNTKARHNRTEKHQAYLNNLST